MFQASFKKGVTAALHDIDIGFDFVSNYDNKAVCMDFMINHTNLRSVFEQAYPATWSNEMKK